MRPETPLVILAGYLGGIEGKGIGVEGLRVLCRESSAIDALRRIWLPRPPHVCHRILQCGLVTNWE